MITFVAATRSTFEDFWGKSALGISLNRLRFDTRLNARITLENSLPLASAYNYAISAANPEDILVFVHDDVWLDDYYLGDRVIDGLKTFDVIGVVGNKCRAPAQPSWVFKNTELTMDSYDHFSGAIAHGELPGAPVSLYGETPASCELLDGVFLASKRDTLVKNSLFFDPQFNFHFYDLDFCRTVKKRGLQLGTWPVCITHQSVGSFGSPAWLAMAQLYFHKWGD
jgi:GT2 family glycosyltransferase